MNLFGGEGFDSEQVWQALKHCFLFVDASRCGLQREDIQETRSTSITRSSPSISCSRTSTISVSLVSTVRPTKLASTGSSRCPRSISTQSRMRRGPAEIEKAVHRRTNRAAGVENVVHDHEVAAVHGEIDVCGLNDRLRAYGREVVAVERDVQRADRHFCTCVKPLNRFASRWDSGTPRRRTPMKARSFGPPLFSTISWANRWRVRSISSAERSCLFSTTRIGRSS